MDLAAGCMGGGGGGGGGGDLYYWWQWLHNFSMQEYVFGPSIVIDNLGVHVVKRNMTIARSIHTLHPSEPIIRLQ